MLIFSQLFRMGAGVLPQTGDVQSLVSPTEDAISCVAEAMILMKSERMGSIELLDEELELLENEAVERDATPQDSMDSSATPLRDSLESSQVPPSEEEYGETSSHVPPSEAKHEEANTMMRRFSEQTIRHLKDPKGLAFTWTSISGAELEKLSNQEVVQSLNAHNQVLLFSLCLM